MGAEGKTFLKLMLLVLLLGPLFRVLGRKETVQRWVEHHRNGVRRGCLGFCVVLVAVVVGVSLGIAWQDKIYHDEATVLSIAAGFAHSQQMYPLASEPVEYGLLYGPATYLVYVPPMMFGAERFGVYLAWVALAFAGSLGLVFVAMKRRYGGATALCSTVLLTAFACPFLNYEWAIRGDVWILLFTAAGLWASRLRRPWVATLLIAVSGAMIVDLKAPLLAVALLPCATLWIEGKQARLAALLSGLGIPVLALAPFALKRISLQGYMEQLGDAAHHRLSLALFERNLLFGLYFVLPTLGLLWTAWEQDRDGMRRWVRGRWVYLVLTGCALGTSLLTGSKNGAGPWHLAAVAVPFVEIDAALFTRVWRRARANGVSITRVLGWPLAIAVVMIANLFLGLGRGVGSRVHGPAIFREAPMRAVERDLLAMMAAHPGEKMEMGYTDLDHYELTFARPLLQMRGMPLFLDAVSRNEADLIGKPMPEGMRGALDRCAYRFWVLPAEGKPFSMESLYFLGGTVKTREMYPESFAKDFEEHYRMMGRSEYFALWECQPDGFPVK